MFSFYNKQSYMTVIVFAIVAKFAPMEQGVLVQAFFFVGGMAAADLIMSFFNKD